MTDRIKPTTPERDETPRRKEKLAPKRAYSMDFHRVGRIYIIQAETPDGKQKAILSTTPPELLLGHENGSPDSSFQKLRDCKTARAAFGAAALGVLGTSALPALQAKAMGPEDVPEFEDPQPASWTVPGDQHPNISEIDGKKVILFHRSTEDPYNLLQYVDCDELEGCLAQETPQAVEGIQTDMTAAVHYAYIYQNSNGEYILRYREGPSVFERPVSFVDGVLTASGTKTSVTIPPNSGFIDDDGVPHVMRSFSNTSFDERSVKNLDTGDISDFQVRNDNKGLDEANVCGIPHYCNYNAMAIGSRLRELYGGTQVCDLVVADSLEELMTSIYKLDATTFPPAHQPRNPRLAGDEDEFGNDKSILIYTTTVEPSPGEGEGRRIWYAVKLEQEPPENPTLEVVDVDGVAQPITVDYGTTLEIAKAQLPGTIIIKDSGNTEYLVSVTWTIPGYEPLVPDEYTAIGTWEIPIDPETGEPVMEGEATPLEVTATVDYANVGTKETVDPITVAYGTPEEDVLTLLPTTVKITDNAEGEHDVEVDWNLTEYDSLTSGQITVKGTLINLPSIFGTIDPPLKVYADITVEGEDPEKPTITNIEVPEITVEVEHGTSLADALEKMNQSIQTVTVIDSEGINPTVGVTWYGIEDYDPANAKTYKVLGIADLAALAETHNIEGVDEEVEAQLTVKEKEIEPDPCDFAREAVTHFTVEGGENLVCNFTNCHGETKTFHLDGTCEITIDMGGEKDPVWMKLNDVEIGVNLFERGFRLLYGEIEDFETNGNQVRISYGSYGFGPEGTRIRIKAIVGDGISEIVEAEVMEGALLVDFNEEFIRRIEAGETVRFEDGVEVDENGENGNGNGEENGNGNGEENGEEDDKDDKKKPSCGGCETSGGKDASALVLLGLLALLKRRKTDKSNG